MRAKILCERGFLTRGGKASNVLVATISPHAFAHDQHLMNASPILALLQVAEEPGFSWGSFPWIDKVAAVLLIVFALLGFWRGLWWQVLRMVAFIGAFAAARLLSPQVEPLLTDAFSITDPRFSQGLAWVAIFVACLIIAVLIGRLGNKLLESLKLGLANRFAGCLAGAATGLAIHSAFLAVLSLLAPQDWLNAQLQESVSSELLAVLAERWPVIVDQEQGQWIGNELLTKPMPSGFPPGTFTIDEPSPVK
jgi:uncharacterized membrane protein required for colicin V production